MKLRMHLGKCQSWIAGAAFACFVGGSCSGQKFPSSQPTLGSEMSSVAAFEALENAHLKAAQEAVDRLLAVRGVRTVDNTLVPYDAAFDELQEAEELGWLVQAVHPDAKFRDDATAMVTKVDGGQTVLALNAGVYKAMAAINLSKFDAATQYYVKRQLLEFRLAGVDKDGATRTQLMTLKKRLSEAQARFERNIADGDRAVEVRDVAELDGLPVDYIASHKADAQGVIHLTTRSADVAPVLKSAKSDALRKRMFEASGENAYPENDAVLREMMNTRSEIARLVGYTSWSDLNAQDKMIGSSKDTAAFIAELDRTARPAAQREFAMLLAEKRKTDPGATQIEQYQVAQLLDRVRLSQYDFDTSSVRAYFPYEQVKDGLLATAEKLFRLDFRQERNAPEWDPAVETWDVLEDGKAVGRFYLDLHPRPGKVSHGVTFTTVTGLAGRRLPEGVLVCSLPQPTATDPALMRYADAVVFFHEFGHLMRHILAGKQRWAGISGDSAEPDFNEAPSQMLEAWMRSPAVLATFARNYKTGEPIPAELVRRMNRASAFGRASMVTSSTALAALSYDLYDADPVKIDPYAMDAEEKRRYMLIVPSKGSHAVLSFFSLAGYSSSYYRYMWDKVIAEDLYAEFDQADPFAGDTPMRYRRDVLEPGGSMPAKAMLKNFLGRPVNMEAFKRWLGEEFAEAPATRGATHVATPIIPTPK
jgi:thimet oligopeptidase